MKNLSKLCDYINKFWRLRTKILMRKMLKHFFTKVNYFEIQVKVEYNVNYYNFKY